MQNMKFFRAAPAPVCTGWLQVGQGPAALGCNSIGVLSITK